MKIKCPKDSSAKTPEECIACSECYPPVITNAIIKPSRERGKSNGKPRFGVGRLVKECLRNSYYDLVEEVAQPPEKLWIFGRGEAIHAFFQKGLEENEKEVFVSSEFPAFTLIGFVDAIHQGILYEFKTVVDIPAYPQNHHVLQAQGYYSMLPPEKQAEINKILIVYASLKSIKVFEVPKRNILTFLEAQGIQLAIALKESKAPIATRGWLCDLCDFREHCARDGMNSEQKKLGF